MVTRKTFRTFELEQPIPVRKLSTIVTVSRKYRTFDEQNITQANGRRTHTHTHTCSRHPVIGFSISLIKCHWIAQLLGVLRCWPLGGSPVEYPNTTRYVDVKRLLQTIVAVEKPWYLWCIEITLGMIFHRKRTYLGQYHRPYLDISQSACYARCYLSCHVLIIKNKRLLGHSAWIRISPDTFGLTKPLLTMWQNLWCYEDRVKILRDWWNDNIGSYMLTCTAL